jgi:hypothetical protein
VPAHPAAELDEWQQSITCLRHHEQEHERTASDELRARNRSHSVLELLNKLSDHMAMISPPVGRRQGTQRCAGSRLASGSPNRPVLTVRMLGGFELDFDGQPVREWHDRRALSIIQFRILNRRYAVCRETMIDAIWREIPTDRGRRRLHQGIYDYEAPCATLITRTHIICVDGSYRLNPAIPVWVDSEEFDRLVSAAGRSHTENRIDEAFELRREADARYHGDFLSDTIGADWATVERNRRETGVLQPPPARRVVLATVLPGELSRAPGIAVRRAPVDLHRSRDQHPPGSVQLHAADQLSTTAGSTVMWMSWQVPKIKPTLPQQSFELIVRQMS